MTIKKTKLCLGVALATITMAGALVSPQAAAKIKPLSRKRRQLQVSNAKQN